MLIGVAIGEINITQSRFFLAGTQEINLMDGNMEGRSSKRNLASEIGMSYQPRKSASIALLTVKHVLTYQSMH